MFITVLGVTRQWITAAFHFFGMTFDRIFIPVRNVFSQICNIKQHFFFSNVNEVSLCGTGGKFRYNEVEGDCSGRFMMLEPVGAGCDRTLGCPHRNRHR